MCPSVRGHVRSQVQARVRIHIFCYLEDCLIGSVRAPVCYRVLSVRTLCPALCPWPIPNCFAYPRTYTCDVSCPHLSSRCHVHAQVRVIVRDFISIFDRVRDHFWCCFSVCVRVYYSTIRQRRIYGDWAMAPFDQNFFLHSKKIGKLGLAPFVRALVSSEQFCSPFLKS